MCDFDRTGTQLEFPVDDSGQALALMPFDVATWTEEEARVQFQRFRWSEHGGRPTCGHCGSDAVNTHKRRRIYKCKNCFRQFSDTSGTPWAYRKLGFRKLMLVISVFADNRQAVPARTLARQLRLNYKTVLLWVHMPLKPRGPCSRARRPSARPSLN